MLGIERRQKIMECLKRDRKVYVAALSKLFKVTEETIRRDLEKLENEELLSRSYGGAVLRATSEDLPFPKRTVVNSAFKRCVAEKAERLLSDNDTLMIDASTTGLALIHRLIDRKNITVITNSVKLVNDFATANFNIISSGGNLRAHSYALVGANACRTLKSYYVDLAVISCKGIDIDRGVMESNEAESVIKQTMIAQAKTKVLLVDHTKFDVIAFTKTMDFHEIDYVVTDQTPDRRWREFFECQRIKLIC